MTPKIIPLKNGLTVIYQETPGSAVSACHLLLVEGSSTEAPKELGVTTLLWTLLLKGTETKNARRLAEDLEGIGAHLGAGVSHDSSHVSCHAISDYFSPALEMMSEVLFKPNTTKEEMEKERTALIAGIRSKKENIFTVANEEMNAHLFRGHPYGHASSGTEESVAALTLEAVQKRRKRILSPAGAILSIATPKPFSELKAHINALFGPEIWPKPSTKAAPIPAIKTKVAKKELLRKEPFEQAYLLIGFPAPSLSSKDYAALKILSTLLGGGMSSRLFQSLREERGLAYDVGAYFPSRLKGSAFVIYMGLQESKLAEAKKGILDQLADLRTKKISATELRDVKNYLKGSFILDHQTNSQQSFYVAWSYSVGKGLNYDRVYLREIDKVTPADLLRVAKKYLGAPSVSIEIHPAKTKMAHYAEEPKPLGVTEVS
jgi:predicted Zn-dependent peptidase